MTLKDFVVHRRALVVDSYCNEYWETDQTTLALAREDVKGAPRFSFLLITSQGCCHLFTRFVKYGEYNNIDGMEIRPKAFHIGSPCTLV